VANQITDISTGAEAYLIVGGAPVLNAGNTSLPATNGTVEVLHEVTVAIITVIDTLTVSASLMDSSGAPLAFPAEAVIAGYLAPVSNIGIASSAAPDRASCRSNHF
jgi:hypothetical protein